MGCSLIAAANTVLPFNLRSQRFSVPSGPLGQDRMKGQLERPLESSRGTDAPDA